MDEVLRAQIDAYLPHLAGLVLRGRDLRDRLAADPSSASALAGVRVWQQDCAAAINHLSGGSKAHWLARAYSDAFLVRSASPDGVIKEAAIAEIVGRIVDVFAQATESLSRMHRGGQAPAPEEGRRHFRFVQTAELRPVLEQAYADSRKALEEGRYQTALITTCGVLEAIVTDALTHFVRSGGKLSTDGETTEAVDHRSFASRLAAAERAGLIRGGSARLPSVARRYRELADADGELPPNIVVSERDARLASQVLHVIMRDLDPGR